VAVFNNNEEFQYFGPSSGNTELFSFLGVLVQHPVSLIIRPHYYKRNSVLDQMMRVKTVENSQDGRTRCRIMLWFFNFPTLCKC